VPNSFWQRLFLEHHHTIAKFWGPLVGPLVAIISFVCSIGNVPLAAVLWNGGISFGGVLAFIFADLIILPILGKSVTLTLVPAANNAFNGFNFNGRGRGEVLVQVPRGWRVTVRCVNDVSSGHHSCAIVKDAGNATAPIFPGAASPDPQTGLAPGRSARFSFVARRLGVYRIACLVPEYERAGMWAVFEISLSRGPSVARLRTFPGEP